MRSRLIALAAALSLTACVPWTVRPLDDGKQTATGVSNPVEFAASIWDSKVVPTITRDAVDARALLDAFGANPEAARTKFGKRESGGPAYYMVKGEGRVLAVNVASRARTITIDVAPFDGTADVSVQAGPVLRGTSLRDATGLVHFTDFVNQIQYAEAGNALNDRVWKTVLESLDIARLPRKTVSFAGTVGEPDRAAPFLRDLMPVRLTLAEGR